MISRKWPLDPEIKTSPTVVVIDLIRLRLSSRINPIGKRPLANPIKDLVELRLTDEEGIVLWTDLAIDIHEIEVRAVGGRDYQKRPPPSWSGQAQDLRQKGSRCFAVSNPNNSVVEINGHARLRFRCYFAVLSQPITSLYTTRSPASTFSWALATCPISALGH